MALPGNFSTVPVHGKYLDLAGVPLAGTVTFTATPDALTDPAALIIIMRKPLVVTLDVNGEFTTNLPATDDPDIDPIGFTYKVVESFPGRDVDGREYYITVPVASLPAGIDLTTAAPAVPVDGVARGQFLHDLADVDTTGAVTDSPLVRDSSGEWVAGPALSATFAPKLSRRDLLGIVGLAADMASPPTVVAPSTSSGFTTAIVTPDRLDAFLYSGSPVAYNGATFPDALTYVAAASAGVNNTAGAVIAPPWRVSFTTDAPTFEIVSKGTGAGFRVLVDGAYVTAGGGATATPANTGSFYYTSVAHGSRKLRRIDVDFPNSGTFAGLKIGATDTVVAAAPPRLRAIVLGDSFTEGTGATQAYSGFVQTLAQLCGWEAWASGWGGTGYINPGSGRTKLRDRVQADVIQFAPDVVIVAAGINDYGSPAATIGTEAAALFATIKAGLPNLQKLIVVSPFWRNGVSTYPGNLLPTRDAIKTAALAAGAIFLDVLEMDAPAQVVTTTLSANVSGGATSISVPVKPSGGQGGVPDTLEIGSAGNTERALVTAWTGSGPYTVTLQQALNGAHSSGDPVRSVGASLWTGTGKVGTTTGVGNSDLLVSSDGTHPSQAGHDAIARVLFRQLAAQLPS